jgi:hypothetical protein
VSFHPNLAIDWQIKIGGGSWFSVGASINHVYVSLRSPSVSDQVYRTLVHNATRDAQGATGSLDAIMGIFNAFQTLNVTTWDGHLLKTVIRQKMRRNTTRPIICSRTRQVPAICGS